MIRVGTGQVTDQQLIFFASELEFAAAHLKDCVDFGWGNELVEARDVLNSSVIVFKEVLENYKKSSVVYAKLALKGDDLVVHAERVLDLCSLKLRDSMKLLPQ